MTYYILARHYAGIWSVEFGDYDRDTVAYERDDLHHGYESVPYRDLKLIKLADDTQAATDAAIATLNAN